MRKFSAFAIVFAGVLLVSLSVPTLAADRLPAAKAGGGSHGRTPSTNPGPVLDGPITKMGPFVSPTGDFPILSAVRYRNIEEVKGVYCVNPIGFMAPITLFNEDVVVGPHGTLRVDLWATASIGSGASQDGVFFDCLISQNTTTWFCPGSEGAPYMARRTSGTTFLDPPFYGNGGQTSFFSILSSQRTPLSGPQTGLIPGVSANVKILLYTFGGQGEVCGANLAVGY